ncbi:MAG: carboxypeptidase regulatory-like domain-containing protein [Pedobacter sp.]|nr:MAG: carboxypeptidase regulatory-like domain-containing protein [Pedobacter sp.]
MRSSFYKYLALAIVSFVVIVINLSFKLENTYRSVKEKIYLHTDKPYYNLRDTIWFKAYLTINDRPIPSDARGICYVDLITDRNVIDTTLKLTTKGGLTSGYLALGNMRIEGIYRLRAYTKYMLQNTVDHTFDRAFIVGDGFSTKIIDVDAKRNLKVNISDTNLLGLKISSNKPLYKPRELVELDISSFSAIGDQPTTGNFSISVVDENQVPYADDPTTNIVAAMHPYNDLRDLISSTFREYTNERGITVSGMVKTLTGEPIANGKVSLLSLNGGIMEEVKTNPDGRFKFEDLLLYGDINFMVQARTQAGSKKVEVILDKTPATSFVEKRRLSLLAVTNEIDTLKIQEIRKNQDKARTATQNRIQRLNEVNIRARRREDPRYATQGGLRIPEGHSDQTYILDKPELCATLGICLQGKLQGVVFREIVINRVTYTSYPFIKNAEAQMAANVIVDGRKLEPEDVGDIFSNNTLNAVDIVKIEVVRTNAAITSMLSGPSILIYTKGNKDKFRKPVLNIAYLDVKGMQRSKNFYSPDYGSKTKNKLNDFRSTIYWNPNVKTDLSGSAKVQFYTADEEGTYKVTLEGMTKDGKLGSQIYRFNVRRKK